MDQGKLEILCNNMVILNRERYIEFEKLMTNKALVIKELIKDVQATLEISDEAKQDIISSFDKVPCKIISHDGELLVENIILNDLVSSLR